MKNSTMFFPEHLQVHRQREVSLPPSWGSRAFGDHERGPLCCICERGREEQRKGWERKWWFCMVSCQWCLCPCGFPRWSSTLRGLHLILWKDLREIYFPYILCFLITVRGSLEHPWWGDTDRDSRWVYNNSNWSSFILIPIFLTCHEF